MTELKVKPKIDIAFKKIFSENLDLLKSLVSAALGFDAKKVELCPNEIPPAEVEHKFCRLDLRVRVDGQEIDIEVQCYKRDDFQARAEYYSSLMFTRLHKGENYTKIPKTVLINIVDYPVFNCKEYHSVFVNMEVNRHEVLTDKKVIHFFELGKIPSLEDSKNNIELWLNLINADSEEKIEALETVPIDEIKKAVGEVKRLNRDRKFIITTEARENALREEMSALSAALDTGIKMGREEGREEERFDIARNMLTENMPLDIIGKLTGLSIKAIENLRM
ncbi:MAG: Rpn family recombination-promoting nuclease/putative transposase [Oscillospiraceae bacterium]|nr:Rpn family recombination-promoting nuclease/putative transposase [Oscillospiraceae bacterium]